MQIWTWAPAIGWANHHIDNLTIFFLSIKQNILKREYDEKKYGVLIKWDVSLDLPTNNELRTGFAFLISHKNNILSIYLL